MTNIATLSILTLVPCGITSMAHFHLIGKSYINRSGVGPRLSSAYASSILLESRVLFPAFPPLAKIPNSLANASAVAMPLADATSILILYGSAKAPNCNKMEAGKVKANDNGLCRSHLVTR